MAANGYACASPAEKVAKARSFCDLLGAFGRVGECILVTIPISSHLYIYIYMVPPPPRTYPFMHFCDLQQGLTNVLRRCPCQTNIWSLQPIVWRSWFLWFLLVLPMFSAPRAEKHWLKPMFCDGTNAKTLVLYQCFVEAPLAKNIGSTNVL